LECTYQTKTTAFSNHSLHLLCFLSTELKMTNPDETTALKSYQSVPVEQLESGDAENTQNLEVSEDSSLFASASFRRRSSLLFVTIGMVVFVTCMRLSYSLGVKHVVATVDAPVMENPCCGDKDDDNCEPCFVATPTVCCDEFQDPATDYCDDCTPHLDAGLCCDKYYKHCEPCRRV
jgi:hypothetical protein